jgi:hypothetical protein
MCMEELQHCNETNLCCRGSYCYEDTYCITDYHINNYYYLDLIFELIILSQIITGLTIICLIVKAITYTNDSYIVVDEDDVLRIKNRK